MGAQTLANKLENKSKKKTKKNNHNQQKANIKKTEKQKHGNISPVMDQYLRNGWMGDTNPHNPVNSHNSITRFQGCIRSL